MKNLFKQKGAGAVFMAAVILAMGAILFFGL